jgi:hypothetical protein
MPGSTLAEIDKIIVLARNGNTQAKRFLTMENSSGRDGLEILAEAGDEAAAKKMERNALQKTTYQQRYKKKVGMRKRLAGLEFASTPSSSRRAAGSSVVKRYGRLKEGRQFTRGTELDFDGKESWLETHSSEEGSKSLDGEHPAHSSSPASGE